MSERSQITHMQVRIVRMATEKWNVAVAEMFQKYHVFGYKAYQHDER